MSIKVILLFTNERVSRPFWPGVCPLPGSPTDLNAAKESSMGLRRTSPRAFGSAIKASLACL